MFKKKKVVKDEEFYKKRKEEILKQRLQFLSKLEEYTKDIFGEGTSVQYSHNKDSYEIIVPKDFDGIRNIIKRMNSQINILKDAQFFKLEIDQKIIDIKKQFEKTQLEITAFRKNLQEIDIQKEVKSSLIDKASLLIAEYPIDEVIQNILDKGYNEDIRKTFKEKAQEKLKEFKDKANMSIKHIKTETIRIISESEKYMKEYLKKPEREHPQTKTLEAKEKKPEQGKTAKEKWEENNI